MNKRFSPNSRRELFKLFAREKRYLHNNLTKAYSEVLSRTVSFHIYIDVQVVVGEIGLSIQGPITVAHRTQYRNYCLNLRNKNEKS